MNETINRTYIDGCYAFVEKNFDEIEKLQHKETASFGLAVSGLNVVG